MRCSFIRRFIPTAMESAAFAFEDAWFNAADGTRLARLVCAVRSSAGRDLVLPMATAATSPTAPICFHLCTIRCDSTVMIFDYRGYGRSDGVPSEQGILADGRAARKWLANRAGIAESQIVIWASRWGAAWPSILRPPTALAA